MFVPRSLLASIDEKKRQLDLLVSDRVSDEGWVHIQRVNMVDSFLRQLVDQNSVRIEEPHLARHYTGKNRREMREKISMLHDAYLWAFRLADKDDLQQPLLTEEGIRRLNGYVHYGKPEIAPYRTTIAIIQGSNAQPPNPAKFDQLLPKMYDRMQTLYQDARDDLLHPVEYALFSHAAIAAVHPFVDGNGRTARITQNALLAREGFPVALLQYKDRTDYFGAVRQACQGYLEGNNRDLVPFGQFMGAKVLHSLDLLLSKRPLQRRG